MIINFQGRHWKGEVPMEKVKETLFSKGNFNCDIRSLQLDHRIPFCISQDDSLSNLQLLTPRQHKLKSGLDRRITHQLRKKGMIESVTHYSIELKVPKEEAIQEYKKWWSIIVQERWQEFIDSGLNKLYPEEPLPISTNLRIPTFNDSS